MSHWSHPDSTRAFDGRASLYEQGRPPYPDRAVDALLEGLGPTSELVVADVGAGTGLLTRPLAARGCRVIAIEPNDEMLEAAARHPPDGIEWRRGTDAFLGIMPEHRLAGIGARAVSLMAWGCQDSW